MSGLVWPVARTGFYLYQPLVAFQAVRYHWSAEEGFRSVVEVEEVPHQMTGEIERGLSPQERDQNLNRIMKLFSVNRISLLLLLL